MREGSFTETLGHHLTIDVLLSDQTHYLGEVGLVSFGLGGDHFVDVVGEGRHCGGYELLAYSQYVVELLVCVDIEGLHDCFLFVMEILGGVYPGFRSEYVEEFPVASLRGFQLVLDCLEAVFGRDDVSSSDTETVDC